MQPFILVVDDKEDACRSICATLRDAGFQPIPVENVQEAVAHLARARNSENLEQRYSVAVIDLHFENAENVPNQETAGLIVLKEAIKDEFLEPIILTGRGSEEAASQALELGAYRYIQKGKRIGGKDDLDRLVVAVKQAIELRANMINLSRQIRELRDTIAPLRAAGALKEDLLTFLSGALFDTDQIYRHILHTRGKATAVVPGI